MLVGELAVEGLLWGEAVLSEAIPVVHVLIGVDPFLRRSYSRSASCSYREVILKASGGLAATSLSREANRNITLSMKRSRPRELLRVIGDVGDPTIHLANRLHKQVGVVHPEVVEDHRYSHRLGAQP